MSYELKRLARALAAAGAAAGIAAVLVTAAGCGKEGPPTPPFRALPAPTTDLAAHERGTHVVLSFKYPQTTPGGQALNGLSKVEVWEAVVTPEPPKADKSKKDAKSPADAKGASASKGTSATTPGSTAAAAGAMPATSTATSTTASTTTTATSAAAMPGSPDAGTSGAAASPTTSTTSTTASGTTAAGATTPDGTTTTPAGTPGTAAITAPAPGTPDPLDTKQLVKLAKLKLTLTTKDIAAATLGSRIVVDLPLPEPLPVLPPVAAPAAGAGAPSGPPNTSGTTGATGTSGATGATAVTGTAGTPGTAAANAPRLPIHYYVVRTFGPQGDRSEFSNQAILVARVGPVAPEGVTVTAEAEDIRVEWKNVPDAGGYAIYRRAATERFNSQPLAVVRPPGDSYLDTKAEFGQSYIYSVTALDAKDPLIESAIKAEQEIHYIDKFPPPVPEELVTVAETAKVRLVWRQVEAGDLAGYIVYRKSAGGDFTRLTAQPIGGTNYIDSTAVSGQSYDYRVSAIDKTGNESAPSAEVHVAVP